VKMIPDAHWKLPESHSWKWLRQFLLQPPPDSPAFQVCAQKEDTG